MKMSGSMALFQRGRLCRTAKMAPMGPEENDADGQTEIGKEAGPAVVLLSIFGRVIRFAPGQESIDLVPRPGRVIAPGNQLLPEQKVEPGHIDDPHGDDEDHQPEEHGAEVGADEELVNPEGMAQVQADDEELTDEGHQHGEGGQGPQVGQKLDPEDVGEDGDEKGAGGQPQKRGQRPPRAPRGRRSRSSCPDARKPGAEHSPGPTTRPIPPHYQILYELSFIGSPLLFQIIDGG